MYLSTFQVLYKLYLSTDVLKYKVLLPGSAEDGIRRKDIVSQVMVANGIRHDLLIRRRTSICYEVLVIIIKLFRSQISPMWPMTFFAPLRISNDFNIDANVWVNVNVGESMEDSDGGWKQTGMDITNNDKKSTVWCEDLQHAWQYVQTDHIKMDLLSVNNVYLFVCHRRHRHHRHHHHHHCHHRLSRSPPNHQLPSHLHPYHHHHHHFHVLAFWLHRHPIHQTSSLQQKGMDQGKLLGYYILFTTMLTRLGNYFSCNQMFKTISKVFYVNIKKATVIKRKTTNKSTVESSLLDPSKQSYNPAYWTPQSNPIIQPTGPLKAIWQSSLLDP